MSSITAELTHTCPYCKRQYNMTVYHTVDVGRDPELRDACLSGEIFTHSCPHCQKKYIVTNPLLYMDVEHRFVILFSETGHTYGMLNSSVALTQEGFILRRCLTLEEFTEKIRILEEGADDVMVELAKYDSFIEYIDNRKGNPEDITGIRYEYTKDDIMKITILADDKSMSFLIPICALKAELEAQADVYMVDNTMFPIVNGQWILSLFKEPEGQA